MMIARNIQRAGPSRDGTAQNRSAERIPMHPDDFAAHRAWVAAKRSHETRQETGFSEKPVYVPEHRKRFIVG